MNDDDLLRYSRNILLNQVGIEGQEKWLAATILVIGCGGLGNAALPILAAAGVGSIIIVDDDYVELSNLQRQTQYVTEDIGNLKAEVMKKKLHDINPNISILSVTQRINAANNLIDLFKQANIILDCSDNFQTRKLINRQALDSQKILVSGSASRFDGQLLVFNFQDKTSPCYSCLFEGEDTIDGECALLGVFSPLVAIVGAMQAAETLKILANIDACLSELICLNILDLNIKKYSITKNPCCSICKPLKI